MNAYILEKLKQIFLFIKTKVIPVLFSVRLWLTLAVAAVSAMLCKNYYTSEEVLYGLTFYKIDYCILGIIVSITSVLAYNIFSYICNFKSVEKKSVSDILLTCIFIILLFIPASHINKVKSEITENRQLAEYPQIFNDYKINKNFGKEFENWFNDRFFLRNYLIYLNTAIQKSINNIYKDNDVIVFLKSGWFFLRQEIKNTYKIPVYNELYMIKANLNRFNDFCILNNIKVYFVIIPDKSNVYREFIITEKLKNRQTYADRVYQYLNSSNDTSFTYIYPADRLIETKKSQNKLLFYKQDSHQTDFGGYIVYQALMKEINKDFPEIKTAKLEDFSVKKCKMVNYGEKEKDFHLGNVNEMSLKDIKYMDYENEYYYPKDKNIITEQYDDPYLLKNRTHNPLGKRKVILLGSSFVEKINLFIKSSFEYTDKIRLNTAYEKNFHVIRFEDYLINEKPDVLIVVLNESELFDYISTMYNDKLELEP